MNVLNSNTICQDLKRIDFPYPSPHVARAFEIVGEIKMGKKYPFKEVLHVHSVDPQGAGQKPITFIKQVLSVCINESLLESDNIPSDVKNRAMNVLGGCFEKRIGAYSHYQGSIIVRKEIAKFLEQRDGVPSNFEDIFLTNGASDALQDVLFLFSNKAAVRPPGVMIPIPQYPLFSSTIGEYGMYQINYYLDEESQWSIEIPELRRAINESRMHCEPKVLVIINPGNPTGYTLSINEMRRIVEFAYEEKLFILTDEIYQQNVIDPDVEFHSFKKVICEMGPPYNKVQCASVMSASKGYTGESGNRGGYCELLNVDRGVRTLIYKKIGLKTNSSVIGQIVMYCIANPPQPNEPSYGLFEMERNFILNSLKEKAQYCYMKLKSVRGLSCNKVIGAMCIYPRLLLSTKALKEAQARNQSPDEFYCAEMLENSGVCVLPGSLFGQLPGKYYFRLTFLPPMKKLEEIIENIITFHKSFMEKYND